jgi:hypothetical protein
MVSVLTLHYEFELENNRLHTGYGKDIPSVDIDAYLNRAKDTILERYNELVEKNRKWMDHLRVLHVTDKKLVRSIKSDTYDVYKLPDDYYSYTRVSALACSDKCNKPQVILTTDYTKSDSLNESLKDPFRRPSWYFRRALYNFVDTGLKFYHNDEYDTKEVLLSYIKYLPNVAAPSLCKGEKYLASDGLTVIKKDIHLDLPVNHTLWRKIPTLAAYLFKRDTDENYKVTIESFLFNENLGVN